MLGELASISETEGVFARSATSPTTHHNIWLCLAAAELAVGVSAHVIVVNGKSTGSAAAADSLETADTAGSIKLCLLTHIN